MKPAAATKKPDVKLPFIIFAVIFSASVTIIILFFRFRRKNKEHPERK
jgi:hypothetical protein